MFFKISVHFIIYSSVLFLITNSIKRYKRNTPTYELKCIKQTTAVDQVIDYPNEKNDTRKKRFVLFPEFVNFKGDYRYLQKAEKILYWISNFYPNRINTDDIHRYIKDIIQQINTVLDNEITVQEASDPGEANFLFDFFDYTKCPSDDLPEATIDNVKISQSLLIYPVELTRKSRYRAHGGIHLTDMNQSISVVKLNMQQTFLRSDDFVYDSVIYTCVEKTNECLIDLHYVLLHEALHGFGIEHTTNAEKPIPPNAKMKSVMHFSATRTLCHDDIRAIRMVYDLRVKRDNANYDDTCRRDFPMNSLQKLMYQIGKLIILCFIGFLILSTIIFILTLIYLLIRYFIKQKSSNPSLIPDKKPMITTKRTGKPHAYLWHDEML